MYPTNPDIIKAEMEYRQNQYLAITKREQEALSLVADIAITEYSYMSLIRHKIGNLLINWGTQLVGSTNK